MEVMKKSFLQPEKPLLTVMVQAKTPERIRELIDRSLPEGAEAFGMQMEQLESKYRTPEVYRDLFAYAKDKPVYVTNYRHTTNEGKKDDVLAQELLEFACCGADLCDVMGDYFDRQLGEMTYDKEAVRKQEELIEAIHKIGAKVLMSSHIFRFTPAEEILKIALAHQSRGADICKIVSGADTMEQQIENLRIIHLLKEKLDIPFLFLSSGECHLLRRIGPMIGSCMYLCVQEYDELATPVQPLLKNVKQIRDHFD